MSATAEQNLKILVELGVIGQQDVQAAMDLMNEANSKAAASSRDLSKEMGVVNVSAQDAAKILGKDADETGKSRLGKEQLKQSLRGLIAEYPLLGQAADLAFNPMTIAIGGPLLALGIFTQRVEAAAAALSELALPDLTAGLDQARKLGEHWKGVAEAIAAANKEFNSAEGVYGRTRDAIDKQTDAEKKLLAVHKDQALATLETRKGTMTDTQYQLNKSSIESFYAKQEAGIDQGAADKRMAAKEAETKAAAAQKADLAKQEQAFKLPASQQEYDKQQENLKLSSETFRESVKKDKAEADAMREALYAQGTSGIPGAGLATIAGGILHHGWGSKPSQIAVDADKAAAESSSKADAIERQSNELAKKWAAREGVRTDLSAAAGTSARLNNELPYERANYDFSKRTNAEIGAGRQQVDATKLIATITSGGTEIAKLVEAIAVATAQKDAMLIGKFTKELAYQQRQISALHQSSK